MDDVAAAQVLVLAGGGSMRSLPSGHDERPKRNELSSESVLFLRMGGFGDLCLLTPVLREHKLRYPNARLGVATMAHYAPVLHGLPYIDEVAPYPVRLDDFYAWDSWVFLENAIENNPLARTTHMTEVFGGIAGVEGILNLLPDYRILPSEAVAANLKHPRGANKRAGMQVAASGRCRIYPHRGAVMRELVARGWEVYLFGQEGDLPKTDRVLDGVVDLTRVGYDFRQSVAVMNTCDVLIAPDSALLHVAGALGLPAVGTYGPFPWEVRTKHCPTTVALSGNGDCAPCFHHSRPELGRHFPEHCPSKAKGYCQVLADIDPKRVAAKAEQIARKVGSPMAGVGL